MLHDDDVHALVEARHPDPFAVLGMHAEADGALCVRALLPRAVEVAVHDTRTGARVARLARRYPAGLFEGPIPRRRRPFDYRLQVAWDDGSATRLADPYRIGPLIGELDLHYLGEGSHLRPFEVLGAHPATLGEGVYAVDGVRFAVWAPDAARVAVVGDFNGWDARRHPMRARGGAGIWELFVPHAIQGDRYKYAIRARDGAELPLKCDPYARAAQ
ncbi:MAG TPA: 1,4-alpha-glucan branching enzyme, partial [Rubrivivax sp.]|nr:1,4-alpha-glucan branching enzyme [Rubrivivax sp.]